MDKCLLIFVVITSVVSCCWAVKTSWGSHEYPNPRSEPQKCGRRQRASWVCDPNNIISKRDADNLDWIINWIVNNGTRCPCSTWACQRNGLGYRVGVALVKQMKRDLSVPDTAERRMHDAKNFAFDLENSIWNMGQCEEDIVIFYSQDDGILYIMAGGTARMVLNNTLIKEIGRDHGHYFRPGGDVATGLRHLLMKIIYILKNRYVLRSSVGQYDALIGQATHMTSFPAVILLAGAMVTRLLIQKF